MTLLYSKRLTKHWREIFDPSGSNISQLKRYMIVKTLLTKDRNEKK